MCGVETPFTDALRFVLLQVTIELSDLNITGSVAVRDIWQHADLPHATGMSEFIRVLLYHYSRVPACVGVVLMVCPPMHHTPL